MHLVLNKTEVVSDDQAHINLSDDRYTSLINDCQAWLVTALPTSIWSEDGRAQSTSSLWNEFGSGGFTIDRCGAPLNPDGKNETADVFMSRVLDHIGAIPCKDKNEFKEGESPSSVCQDDGPNNAQILNSINFRFTAGKHRSVLNASLLCASKQTQTTSW